VVAVLVLGVRPQRRLLADLRPGLEKNATPHVACDDVPLTGARGGP
jgi:hypothetical protein